MTPFRIRSTLALLATFTVVAVAGLMLIRPTADAAPAQGGGGPVVVELFQSQGCSSCPPANANINGLAARSDLLVLSYGVTYWDNLGWKDTFASKANTDRQWDYARGLHNGNVGTPQVVINGRRDITGIDNGELVRAIGSAAGPAIVTASNGQVLVAAGARPAAPADVWLVRYDPRVVMVSIRRGENGGKSLPHRNIVREMIRLGQWTGQAGAYRLPAASADDGLKSAVVVQTRGGPILAAGKL